jgi:uncharacterized membrane protein YeiH
VLIGRVPVVLRNELYAVPALVGALSLVVATELGASELPAAVGGAGLCFVIRMVSVHFGLEAPARPRSGGA